MSFEPTPTLRQLIIESVYLEPIDVIEMDAEPILDQTGNQIRDHEERNIYS